MNIRVFGAQLAVTSDIQQNVADILLAIEKAQAEKANILLTPEGSLSGCTPNFDRMELQDALERVTSAARQAHLGLALGTSFEEPEDGKCHNQLRFYDPVGRYLGFHSKILRCGHLTEPPRGEFTHYAATPLRTFDFQGICVGGLICNDMWANPSCTPMPDPHLS